MARGNMAWRTLRTSFWLSVLCVAAGWIGGSGKSALGMAIGAAVGLFSLWSLTVIIPRLIDPSRPGRGAQTGLLYLLKFGIIAATLWFAMTSPSIEPFGVFVGAAIVPVVAVALRFKSALLLASRHRREGLGAIRRRPHNPSSP